MKNNFNDFSGLDAMNSHPVSEQIDELFKMVIQDEKNSNSNLLVEGSAVDDKDLDLNDAEFSLELGENESSSDSPLDEGLELVLDEDKHLDFANDEDSENQAEAESGYGDISLEEEVIENLGELSFPDSNEEISSSLETNDELSFEGDHSLELGDLDQMASTELDAPSQNEMSTILKLDENTIDQGLDLGLGEGDLSDDAKEKLKEIDAIMEVDASEIKLKPDLSFSSSFENLDEPLVSEKLDLGSLNFSVEPEEIKEKVSAAPAKEDKSKKKKKEPEVSPSHDIDLGKDLREISGAYSGEMERMQATISNLRADREELLAKIQTLEEEKIIQNRAGLTVRAELDEKKIELMIIRKKLNEEINDLKDKLKLYDEKRLILEEKNRILAQELDKVSQKNKMDVKRVQMRERELEQKLELLKSDAETQIRNRDLKILELKRKIDAMEFDMESISQQEKRSVESRFELEDKLEKAIKTLRGAITVLEDEPDRTNAINALKKNIDM